MLLSLLLSLTSFATPFNTTWTITGLDGTTSATQANLIWTTPHEGTTAVIYWGLAANNLSLPPIAVSTSSEVHQLSIPHLRPGTRYFFEVEATDPDGVSVYSNVISKVTKAAEVQ
jgi:hypothetical protein